MQSPSRPIRRLPAPHHPLQLRRGPSDPAARGVAMRRIVSPFVLALSLLGCGAFQQQVPLSTVEVLMPDSCWLLYRVLDVVADSTVGTVDKATGESLKWPSGFTGWRVGSEVEVHDTTGKVVLTTGARYRISPANNGSPFDPDTGWSIAGCVQPCPDCELGSGQL
jgi:hypothetical protein